MATQITATRASRIGEIRKLASKLLVLVGAVLVLAVIAFPTRGRPESVRLAIGTLLAASTIVYFAARMRLLSAALVLLSFLIIAYIATSR